MHQISLNFSFYLSQSSEATHLKCDGQYDTGFVTNFSENTTMKEF